MHTQDLTIGTRNLTPACLEDDYQRAHSSKGLPESVLRDIFVLVNDACYPGSIKCIGIERGRLQTSQLYKGPVSDSQ